MLSSSGEITGRPKHVCTPQITPARAGPGFPSVVTDDARDAGGLPVRPTLLTVASSLRSASVKLIDVSPKTCDAPNGLTHVVA